MEIIHLESCTSTSLLLKEKLQSGEIKANKALLSTERQTDGIGRRGNSWSHLDNALAFSFLLEPQREEILTPLEVGVILTEFLNTSGHQVSLKWPNDLLNSQGQKCGGFICDLYDQNTTIVGVGINMGKGDFSSIKETSVPAGAVDNQRIVSGDDMKQLPKDIYEYTLDNRLSPNQILKKWRDNCVHMGKEVKIIDGSDAVQGIFKDIAEDGMAILVSSEGEKKIVTGSLVIL